MPDVPALAELINHHAERGRMLHRSRAYLYERVLNFTVCEVNEGIGGCCALEPVWDDLAEIKSVAVYKDLQGKGIGNELISLSLKRAREIGVKRVFCLTREPKFFERMEFSLIERDRLPHKVWSDCVSCPVKDKCDEIAMLLKI